MMDVMERLERHLNYIEVRIRDRKEIYSIVQELIDENTRITDLNETLAEENLRLEGELGQIESHGEMGHLTEEEAQEQLNVLMDNLESDAKLEDIPTEHARSKLRELVSRLARQSARMKKKLDEAVSLLERCPAFLTGWANQELHDQVDAWLDKWDEHGEYRYKSREEWLKALCGDTRQSSPVSDEKMEKRLDDLLAYYLEDGSEETARTNEEVRKLFRKALSRSAVYDRERAGRALADYVGDSVLTGYQDDADRVIKPLFTKGTQEDDDR